MDDKMIMMSQTQSESESLPTSVKWGFYQVKMLKTYERERRKICVKENKRHPFSQESEQGKT
jgi:hypothetical protein